MTFRRLGFAIVMWAFGAAGAHGAESGYPIDLKRGEVLNPEIKIEELRFEAKADTKTKTIPLAVEVRFDGKEKSVLWRVDPAQDGQVLQKKTTINLNLVRAETSVTFFEQAEDGSQKVLETVTVSFPKITEFAAKNQIPIEEKKRVGIGVFGVELQYRLSSVSGSLFDGSKVALSSLSHLVFDLSYSRSFFNELLWPFVRFGFGLPNRRAPELFTLMNDASFLINPGIGARLRVSDGLFLVAEFAFPQTEYIEEIGAGSVQLVSFLSLAPGAGIHYLAPWVLGPMRLGSRIDFKALLPVQSPPSGADLSTSFSVDVSVYSVFRFKERYLLRPGLGYQTTKISSDQATQASSGLYLTVGFELDFN